MLRQVNTLSERIHTAATALQLRLPTPYRSCRGCDPLRHKWSMLRCATAVLTSSATAGVHALIGADTDAMRPTCRLTVNVVTIASVCGDPLWTQVICQAPCCNRRCSPRQSPPSPTQHNRTDAMEQLLIARRLRQRYGSPADGDISRRSSLVVRRSRAGRAARSQRTWRCQLLFLPRSRTLAPAAAGRLAQAAAAEASRRSREALV